MSNLYKAPCASFFIIESIAPFATKIVLRICLPSTKAFLYLEIAFSTTTFNLFAQTLARIL